MAVIGRSQWPRVARQWPAQHWAYRPAETDRSRTRGTADSQPDPAQTTARARILRRRLQTMVDSVAMCTQR